MSQQSARRNAVHVFPITVPEPLTPTHAEQQSVSEFVLQSLAQNGLTPEPGDVLCLSSKIAALYEGRTPILDSVVPSRTSRFLGRLFDKDPRKLELMRQDGKVAMVIPMRFIAKRRAGRQAVDRLSTDPSTRETALSLVERYEFMMAMHGVIINEAGIDIMNSPIGRISQLPKDPEKTAHDLRIALKKELGFNLPVIITDTIAPFGRLGTVDVAIGFSGLVPVERKLIAEDLFGDLRPGGANIIVDSIAAIAGAVMGQTTEMTPATLIRGCEFVAEDPTDYVAGSGMSRLTYPKGSTGLGVVLTVFVTAWYRLLSLFLPRR